MGVQREKAIKIALVLMLTSILVFKIYAVLISGELVLKPRRVGTQLNSPQAGFVSFYYAVAASNSSGIPDDVDLPVIHSRSTAIAFDGGGGIANGTFSNTTTTTNLPTTSTSTSLNLTSTSSTIAYINTSTSSSVFTSSIPPPANSTSTSTSTSSSSSSSITTTATNTNSTVTTSLTTLSTTSTSSMTTTSTAPSTTASSSTTTIIANAVNIAPNMTTVNTTSSTALNGTTSTVKFNQTAGKIAQIRSGLANMTRYNASMVATALASYGIAPITNQTGFNTTNLTAPQANLIKSSLAGTTANLSEVQLKVQYGSVRSNGRYVGQGPGHYYLSQGANGEVLYNVTVTKATPTLNVNINGYSVSAPNVTVIHLPVVNGSLGINGGHTYSLKGSLSASLLNSVNFTYTVSEGGKMLASSKVASSKLNVPINVSIPLSQNATITFDSQGNENYTPVDPIVVIVPTNITYAIPITFTNSGGVALKANTPLAVGVAGGKVIGFNALAYHQYELPGLNNTEFFYPNGTIVPSWMEGNILNEQTANGIATSFSSKNAIADSANVLFWVEIGQNAPSFLPAGSTTNTIYMGFAGNVITPQNVLFDGVVTGEAPQLSCPVPSITSTCPTYAQYDNGNNIFAFYDDFHGNALNTSKWSGTHTANPLTIANGLEIGETSTTSAAMVSASSHSGYPFWFEGMVLPTTTSATTKTLGFEESTSATKGTSAYDNGYFIGTNTAANAIPVTSSSTGAMTRNPVLTSSGSRPNVLGVSWIATGTVNNAYNYNTNSIVSNALAIGNQYFGVVVAESATGTYDGFVQWVRARVAPAGNVIPASAVGTTPACIATLSLSNQSLNVGQIETITAGEVGCVAPFTYNIIVANSISPSIITKNDLVTANSLSSIKFTYTVTYVGASNSPETVNVMVKDANSNTAITNQTLRVNFPLQDVALNFSPPGTVYAGQSVLLNASWFGGTSPYTVNYIIYNSATNAILAEQSYTGVPTSPNTTVWSVPNSLIGDMITANVVVKGSSAKPETQNSPMAAPVTVAVPTVPAGIQYYVPITLVNNQTGGVQADTPLPIGTGLEGNITGFNALAYSQYFTCDLSNAEFFYANGTVAQSWLEGNMINEQNANPGCTSASSTNALVRSANVLYWVDAPSASFLPAENGTLISNTIFLGWAGNVITPQNDLFDGVVTGEAPQLSCGTPQNTISGCSAGQYGEYDNGAQVFSFYDNFTKASALSSLWSSTHGGTSTITVANVLVISTTTTASAGIISAASFSGYPYWLEGYVLPASTSSANKKFGVEISNSITFGSKAYDNGFFVGGSTSLIVTPLSATTTGTFNTANTALTSAGVRPSALGVAWPSNGIANNNYNYNTNSTTGTASELLTGKQYFGLVLTETASVTYTAYMQWARARIYPPDGIAPSTLIGVVQAAPGQSNNCYISLSNSTVDFGNIGSGQKVSTANAITDTNTGASPANVLIAAGTNGLGTWYGTGNWIGTSAANTIDVSNTVYSLAPQGSYTGTAITNTVTSVGLTIGPGVSNTIYLGMGIPGGTPADTYTTNIVIENSC